MRTVVCTFNVPDDYAEDDGRAVDALDLIQGLVARLDEVYAANNGEVLVPQDVRVAVVPPEAWKWVLDGVDVHLDARAGDEDEETRGAERLVHDMRVAP